MNVRQQQQPPGKAGTVKELSRLRRDEAAASNSSAFHKESLKVIARFNERRCRGLPLFGQVHIFQFITVSPLMHWLHWH